MKNKTKIIILLAVLIFILICCFTIFSFATDLNSSNENLILTKEKIDGINNTYEKISYTNNNNREIINTKLYEYIQKIKVTNNQAISYMSNITPTLEENEYTTNFYKNKINSRVEEIVEIDNDIFCINADTGDLIYYTQKVASLSPSNLDEENIKSIALQIYENMDLIDDANYELSKVIKFDDEIWTAFFDKRYGDLLNQGESIRISFSPETQKIVSLAILDYTYDNNEITISQDEAYKIAKEYMNKTTATDMEMIIEIVEPNYFWDKDNGTYTKIQKCRKAYVFTCNNEAEVKIYVDCTTGEVIGGDMIFGGAL